jgi:choline kinase
MINKNKRCQIRQIEWRRLAKEKEMQSGIWNIKTTVGKEVEITKEMEKYKIQVLGISEVKKEIFES